MTHTHTSWVSTFSHWHRQTTQRRSSHRWCLWWCVFQCKVNRQRVHTAVHTLYSCEAFHTLRPRPVKTQQSGEAVSALMTIFWQIKQSYARYFLYNLLLHWLHLSVATNLKKYLYSRRHSFRAILAEISSSLMITPANKTWPDSGFKRDSLHMLAYT